MSDIISFKRAELFAHFGFSDSMRAKIEEIALPRSTTVNPYCVDNAHALYVGCVCGIAVRNGLPMEFVDDERGVHTDRLMLHLAPNIDITFIVPPPPDDWSLKQWLSDDTPKRLTDG